MTPFFVPTRGDSLAQGDLLPNCPVPLIADNFGEPNVDNTIQIERATLIVMTQSCDLENRKVRHVSLCPVIALQELATADSKFKNPKEQDRVRRGDYVSLHMLASPESPQDNTKAIIVDFRQVYSLPFSFLTRHALNLGNRWRLASPFLEHFSQAFARFFMRVGLPSTIPPFTK